MNQQRLIQESHKSHKPRHDFCCVNCVYEPGKDELGKYAVAYKRGRIRILLEQITLTLYHCPKCGAMHITKDFKDEQLDPKITEKKRQRRIGQLKKLYH